jgi:hypothetical protein
MEDPTKRLGEGIRWIEDSRDVAHDDITSSLPILDGEELDVNVMRSIGRDVVVDHEDRGHVVFVDGSGIGLWEAELSKDRTKVSGLLGGGDSSNELSLCRAGSGEGLSLGTVGDGAASQKEDVAGSGATFTEVVGMGSVNEAAKSGEAV